MKLEKKPQVQAGIEENNSFVSSPPDFDMERLRKVNDLADQWLAIEGFANSALGIACKLGLYNLSTAEPLDSKTYKIFYNRFRILANKEKSFADPANPFPTIGTEVEVPRKRVKINDLPAYAAFFDELGMPRNKVNRAIIPWPESHGQYWEFSPPPSFYAGTQSRIISELIHGGFIPSLLSSQKPDDIRKHLDDKLVSLHINLGIPVETSTFREPGDNLEAFSKMVSLAFTSPLRLQYRASGIHFSIKEGEETSKSKSLGLTTVNRLELKALEVRTESTYRLLKEVQLLGTALFAFLYGGDFWLAKKWQECRERATSLTKSVFIGRGSPFNSERRHFLISQIGQSTIQQDLRSLITGTTIEIAKRYGV